MLDAPEPSPIILGQYRYVARSDDPEYVVMNATEPNLTQFFAHHGKLLLYHGWADPKISPFSTIQYCKTRA